MKNSSLSNRHRLLPVILAFLLNSSCAHAKEGTFDQEEVDQFIRSMVESHDYDQTALERLFDQVQYSQAVIDAITRPAEKLPWYKYKEIFLTEDRINGGVEYWQRYVEDLRAAEDRFGVPPEFIVAIIGVETRYGIHAGRHRVIDSLTTLAFDYPKRADFFRRELEQFLLLTREQDVDPLAIKGSYAGAMGIPQFISSSYRHYGIDFDGDGQVNLWNDNADAIGSVASYFKKHGWQAGEPVIFPVEAMSADRKIASDNPKPDRSYAEIRQAGVLVNADLNAETKVVLLRFETVGGENYWLGLNNFYVITRYNHSSLYALAVHLLAQEIKYRYQRTL